MIKNQEIKIPPKHTQTQSETQKYTHGHTHTHTVHSGTERENHAR